MTDMMTTKEHLSLHDKQIASIRTLVKEGMKMLVRNQEQISQLVAAQRRTDKALKELLESLKTGRNGQGRLRD